MTCLEIIVISAKIQLKIVPAKKLNCACSFDTKHTHCNELITILIFRFMSQKLNKLRKSYLRVDQQTKLHRLAPSNVVTSLKKRYYLRKAAGDFRTLSASKQLQIVASPKCPPFSGTMCTERGKARSLPNRLTYSTIFHRKNTFIFCTVHYCSLYCSSLLLLLHHYSILLRPRIRKRD